MQLSWLALRVVCVTAIVALPLTAFAQPGPDAADEEPDPPAPAPAEPAKPPPAAPAATESNCTDRIDNDNDSVTDCGDADCFDKKECQPTGQKESNNLLCSDWVDNDGDGVMDCDDPDCQGAGITACKGSWNRAGGGGGTVAAGADIPELKDGMTVEDLIGKGGDKDGERNDYLCSDGIDNDGDGRIDCADFGCRFDADVQVCNGNPGLRFSVVTQITHTYRLEDTANEGLNRNDHDTRFSVLQLRALGPIRGIQDSFFLVSMRAERTPRVTFALFQLPVGKSGHFFNINSGGGGLSSGLIISAAKQLLLEAPFYLFNAFEQGNGAAAEFGGPIDDGRVLNFRTFVAGGSGRSSGNVGGRFFADNETNYTWAGGAQVAVNLVGYTSRFDTPFLYTPVPAALTVRVGGKYDQRAQERYPAANGQVLFRYDRFIVQSEVYYKKELEFESDQLAYNVTAGALIWPKTIMLAADFGEYVAGDLGNPPANVDELGDAITQQQDERQWRVGAHFYVYRNTGILSAVYTNREVKDGRFDDDGFEEQDVRFVASYRF